MIKQCTLCKKPFAATHNSAILCDDCVKINKAKLVEDYKRVTGSIKVCPNCAKEFVPTDRRQKYCSHNCACLARSKGLSSVEHYKNCKTRKIENRNVEPTIMHTEIRGRMPCGCARLGTGVATANGREYCMRHGVYA